MKKVILPLLLTFILLGLLGCKSTRVALKTDTKQDVTQTQVTDTSRTEQKTTTDKISAVLASSERQNVVIEFEEWEYYPFVNDTTTGENYAQNSAFFIRANEESADKPPNAGSVKKLSKGTITINADKQTESTSDQHTTSTANVQTAGQTKTDTKAKTTEKAQIAQETSKGKWYVWLIGGLLLCGIGIGIARHA